MGRYFNATLRRNSTGTLAGSGAKKVLKKGTKVTATARSSKVVTVIMKDGTRVRVKGSDLRYNSINATKQEYATNVKEAFVNEKGYSSRTKYLIWVSQYTLSVNVFKGQQGSWKLVRRMPMCYRKRRKNVDRYVPALPKGLCIWRRSDLFYLERAEAVGEFLPPPCGWSYKRCLFTWMCASVGCRSELHQQYMPDGDDGCFLLIDSNQTGSLLSLRSAISRGKE